MKSIRFICLLLMLCALLGMGVSAAEVDCDQVYCFSGGEFSSAEETLAGICVTGLPEADSGTVMLGNRVIRTGDILSATQLSNLSFHPLRTEEDAQATISYLPIYADRVEKSTTMTIGIRGKEDKAPVAEDMALETYKNLANGGMLKASDPEAQRLTYTVVRGPKRGTLEIREDGSFTYTPKKNKVGVDSFTYTAADPAGHVSRVATVTIQILKPADAQQYTDMAGQDHQFEAEWMRNTGLFVGEEVGGQSCFYPEKTVSRAEFLTMVMQVLDIPVDTQRLEGVPADIPVWLQPYLAAAIRSGLTANWLTDQDLQAPITGAEAAVMLQNALDLTVSTQILEAEPTFSEDVPTWAVSSLTVMAENGVALEANAPLTRADAAGVLYRVSYLALEAPGMAIFRMHK
ncbi:MAG: cadherin-like domain-containing protein [Oscillospiraceae bacterium]|nr:cadherin-like domain-containing protein [Oscillospiraceae bacterium]